MKAESIENSHLLQKRQVLDGTVIILAVLFLVSLTFLIFKIQNLGTLSQAKVAPKQVATQAVIDLAKLQEKVFPQKGYVLKIKWGDLGKRMVDDGVIDEAKFAQAITGDKTLPEDYQKYLNSSAPDEIVVDFESAQFWVDLLWGLGLANKSIVLDQGPMKENGDPANFASTGGWTIGKKTPMEIYSKYSYIPLTDAQQNQVLAIAQNIYRPCCGNSTAFPDCNHGMAALGLIELMVSQNFSEEEIYKAVLSFNTYWFPQTYLDVAFHFAKNGKDYQQVPAKGILSKTFSSAMGYRAIKEQIGKVDWPIFKNQGGSCGA